MGQFRPTVQFGSGVRRFADLTPFAVGFLISAITSFAVFAWLGSAVAALAVRSVRLGVLVGVLVALLAVEAVTLLQHRDHSIGWQRQTPRRWGFRPIGVVGWGFDTGLPFTTIRTTALPWAAIAICLSGFGHPLIGLAYAGGFLLSILFAAVVPLAEHGPLTMEPDNAVAKMRAAIRPVRLSSPAFLLAFLAVVTTS